MKNLASLTIAAVLMAIAVVAHAQDTRPWEYAASDKALNETYRQLQSRLNPADQIKLRDAQRLWLTFRDADCAVTSGVVGDCAMERTDQRTEQLRSTYYTDKTGGAFSLDAG